MACATRTVYLQPSEAVMLAETIKGADCWIKTESGEILKSKCTLYEGGFYMSLSDEELKELLGLTDQELKEMMQFKDPQKEIRQ